MAEREFTERWVTNLMEAMEAQLDDVARTELMESCGRPCARANAVASAKASQGDVDKLLSTLEKWIGEGNIQKDGDVVHVVYPRCFCHLVAQGPAQLPKTYCLCSCGWLKEMFETVTRTPVDVEVLESVKRGADRCAFTVRF
jgi:predicted hydrocarbon binding protein